MKYFLTAFLLLQITLLTGQNHYVFFSVDSKNGLSGNRVRSIGQLPDGRLVIITEGLVNLYDGTNFKYLHFDDEKTYPLSIYNGHHRMYIDSNNGLWIKHWHRLMYFDIEKEKFVSNLDSVFREQNINSGLADLFFDSANNLWYLTNDNELYLHNLKTQISTVFVKGVAGGSPERDQLFDISVAEDQLFLFYKSGLMSCYDLNTHQLLYENNPLINFDSLSYQYTLMVVPYKNFLYQIRNGRDGSIMLRYNVYNKKWEKILNLDYRLNTLSIDEEGNSYVSTLRGFWFIKDDLSEKNYISELSLEDGRIFETEISTQYNDISGGLWIGTLNRGLLYYHPNRFVFRNAGYSLFEDFSARNLLVTCFAETSNSILIGTNYGIYQKKKSKKTLSKYAKVPSDIYCNIMLADSKDRIWIGSGNSGLFCINNQVVSHYNIAGDILTIYELSNDTIYLFTSKGIYLHLKNEDRFQLLEKTNSPPFNSIKQVIEIDEGLLCMSDQDLFLIKTLNKKAEYSPFINLNQLTNHKYNNICFDSRGLLWIGTQDGLYVINRLTGLQKNLHTEDGLVNNFVQSVIEDNENKMWVSTSSGISMIEIQGGISDQSFIFTNYNQYDGVLGSEFLPRAVFLAMDNKIYWGGIDGFNEVNTSHLKRNYPSVQKPILSNLIVSGIRVNQSTKYKGRPLLEKSLAFTDKIDLMYDQNFFSVEFSAMNYINAFRTFYRYKLEGFEETWHVTTSTDGLGNATYTNLPPGSYLLKIQSASNQKEWGTDYKDLKIEIHPPVWKTPLFYTFYALVVATLLYFVVRYLIRKNREKREREQKEAFEQMKYLFFTNVSHELRTPLSLIITPLNLIIKKANDPILHEQLSRIKKNADELLKLVNQLLDFRKLEMHGEHLQLSYCNINDMMIAVCISFEEMAGSKKINFTWNANEEITAFVDADKIQKALNNLLSNAFKFTPENGTVSVNLYRDTITEGNQPSFCIEIRDNGFGIPKNDIDRIFDRFYQVKRPGVPVSGSGIGLHMVREYIKMHHGTIKVDSELNKGSLFSIQIPSQLHALDEVEENPGNVNENNKLKLLIVEDNKDFREFLKKELSEHYTILTAVNGADGLKKALENNPEIIVSDYSMPEMNGYELCHKIKSNLNTSHIPFIMLTAHTSDKDQIMSLEAGADAFISKPFNMDILLLRIQKLIELQKERIELFKKAVVIQAQMVTSTTVDEDMIKSALNCIEKNLANPNYSVDQLSKDMCMDRTGLFRKLKAIIGQSPSGFIKSMRLKRSAQLLEKGIPVSEVSEMVGFGSVSYFSKSFFEEFGVKPSQYIKK